MNLETLGWNSFYAQEFSAYATDGYAVGRVVSEQKNYYRLYTAHGEKLAQVSGKMRYESFQREDYPAVGDWVVITNQPHDDRVVIQAILPRISKFSRKAAGTAIAEQIIATNIDTVFLVNALNNDFNLRRLERYLTLAWESGASPVIILSKTDLCDQVDDFMHQVEDIACGVPVHAISSFTQEGLHQLTPYLVHSKTVALLGSSGAGKSTLINALYGANVQAVNDVRQGDDRGRHTTTSRELILLPQGGIIIDTPGMRELQLWGSEDGVHSSFEDVEYLAVQCHFSDCQHEHEPGCAVQQALQDGVLDSARYNSYVKLKKELAYLSRKENKLESLANKQKWKKIIQAARKTNHH